MQRDFADLLSVLANLFDKEGRANGASAAIALRAAAQSNAVLPLAEQTPYPDDFAAAFAANPVPEVKNVSQALPLIRWHYAGLEDGRIRPEIARHMLTAELLGPDGLIFDPSQRVGLFLQRADLNYVTRYHAAEECFVMLAGEGFWSTHGGVPERKTAGNVIFHPSMTPHHSETRTKPLLAAWRWSGDVSWDQYQLKG